MKKLHILVVKSYAGPFVMTFFIVMFILLMQFVWTYIDDFVGKGLEWYTIAELLIYASANLVTLALPLAVLLSSIMTFGGLAEHYELVAMKSSGLSLIKIMMPLIIFSGMLSLGAFYFSNTVSPYATLKFKSLLWDVRKKKPTLDLNENIFYNGLDGYSIRVDKKEEETDILKDLIIYRHTEDQPGNRHVIRAKEGKMIKSENGRYLTLELIDGVSYDEAGNRRQQKNVPHITSEFERDLILLDLSAFDLQRTDEDLWKNHMKMLSMGQLQITVDSLETQKLKRKNDFLNYMNRLVSLNDTMELMPGIEVAGTASFDSLTTLEQRRVVNVAINMTRNAKNYMSRTKEEMKGRIEYINKHKIEWHRKLTLSIACLLLFFIGAPLGAIIKKGGLGLPVIFSVIFFLVWHISGIAGEKMVETGVLSPVEGMWLSSGILFPISLFLTYKAAKDASLFDRDTYSKLMDRLKSFFKKKSHRPVA
ncbi:MAG: LptF/LptG family permease [Flavobacteriales bacterium]|nr:LptF/LptG family permease [Flavobacteriales bacterium]